MSPGPTCIRGAPAGTLQAIGEKITNMATATLVVGSGVFEQVASRGIDEAGAAVRLANGAFGNYLRLKRLGASLSRMDRDLQGFFGKVDSKVDESLAAAGQSTAAATPEQVQEVAHQLLTLSLLLEEIYRRCAARDLTKCSRFGIAISLARVKTHADRLWGWSDWLQLAMTPGEYEGKISAGDEEIERGEFVKL